MEQIVMNIIRPSREKYRISRLGPGSFTIKNKKQINCEISREDFTIFNNKRNKIELSFYGLANQQHQNIPTLIYIHANNGSRIQGLSYLYPLLLDDFNVVLFDCTGSGISEGEYITLGLQQSQDLNCIIEYLYEIKKINQFCLWGRSMGAITALIYASKTTRKIKACIYDSPFSSLKKLIKELASYKSGLPEFFFSPLIHFLEKQIKQKIGFSIYDLKIKNLISSIKCPGYFITSRNDKLVNYRHTQRLYQNYSAQKHIEYIDCPHNQHRSVQVIDKCIQFLINSLGKHGHTKQKTFINLTLTRISEDNIITKINKPNQKNINDKNDKQENQMISEKKRKIQKLKMNFNDEDKVQHYGSLKNTRQQLDLLEKSGNYYKNPLISPSKFSSNLNKGLKLIDFKSIGIYTKR